MAKLSGMRLNAIMINRLYHISDDKDTRDLVKEMKEASEKRTFSSSCCVSKKGTNKAKKKKKEDDLVKDKLALRAGGDIVIDVPKYLDC